MKEIELVLDENKIKSMTADFISNFKSKIDNKSISEISYLNDIIDAYSQGLQDGCLLILHQLQETIAEETE
ncbi:MAG: hypothetical protein ACI4VW_06370 [Acutalibacteraceae bacterium]